MFLSYLLCLVKFTLFVCCFVLLETVIVGSWGWVRWDSVYLNLKNRILEDLCDIVILSFFYLFAYALLPLSIYLNGLIILIWLFDFASLSGRCFHLWFLVDVYVASRMNNLVSRLIILWNSLLDGRLFWLNSVSSLCIS